MDPVTVEINIARPREEIFEYLADIANHPEFCDHFMTKWHLTREESYGEGAGARFKVAPGRFGWGDSTFAEVDPPFRIVEVGRGGKYNRVKSLGVYTLTPAAGGMTKVEFMLETEPKLLSDKILEKLGQRSYLKRNLRKAMKRLRSILEDDESRGRRATLAGG